MTKPQKIEGGWEKEFDKKWDANSNWVDKDKTEEGGYVVFDKGKIKSFISDLLASERQRCVGIIVDYFAGAGELWFPYVGIGVETKEEEREHAKAELEDLLEDIYQAKHDLEQLK